MASNSLKNPGKILEFCGCGKVGTLYLVIQTYFFLQSPEGDKDDGSKRGRYNDENSPPNWDSRQMSAFRPWSPGMLKDAKFREG